MHCSDEMKMNYNLLRAFQLIVLLIRAFQWAIILWWTESIDRYHCPLPHAPNIVSRYWIMQNELNIGGVQSLHLIGSLGATFAQSTSCEPMSKEWRQWYCDPAIGAPNKAPNDKCSHGVCNHIRIDDNYPVEICRASSQVVCAVLYKSAHTKSDV